MPNAACIYLNGVHKCSFKLRHRCDSSLPARSSKGDAYVLPPTSGDRFPPLHRYLQFLPDSLRGFPAFRGLQGVEADVDNKQLLLPSIFPELLDAHDVPFAFRHGFYPGLLSDLRPSVDQRVRPQYKVHSVDGDPAVRSAPRRGPGLRHRQSIPGHGRLFLQLAKGHSAPGSARDPTHRRPALHRVHGTSTYSASNNWSRPGRAVHAEKKGRYAWTLSISPISQASANSYACWPTI